MLDNDWLQACDALCIEWFGLSLHDLPDWTWADACEDELTPRVAVMQFAEEQDDARYMQLIPRQDRAEELWAGVECDADKCGMCPNLRKTRDMYGTGDSPTDYECDADWVKGFNPTDCARVVQQMEVAK